MRRTDPKDSKKRYFRAGDRIVNLNSAWYFTAREGDVGPYPTRSAAEREVQRFLLERQQLSKFQRSRQEGGKQGSKQVPKRAAVQAPKTAARRGSYMSPAQQTRHHLDQKVESHGLMLTLDDDLLV